ncbi:MAG: excinuclease ABC subunit UvrC [Chromatiales bacterium]|nr:excinuclease ABC subunit UvrC [Chromatiales bacterium]
MAEDTFDGKAYARSLSGRPGVYRMLDGAGDVLYVGKARNLKNRVSSYFRGSGQSAKTMAMLNLTRSMEVTVTDTETEALLLEYNLIKQHKPRFNILLRDDKSFPHIHLSTDQEFPRISFHRGSTRIPGRIFGPYPSTHAVRGTISTLQKLFHLRGCKDSYFNNRSRPCLQYQIQRCSGPCVGLISKEDYARDVEDAALFLDGRNQEVTDRLAARMEKASESLEFEKAVRYRDQIAELSSIQASQHVSGGRGSADVIAIATESDQTCVTVLFVRDGRQLGSRNYFPQGAAGSASSEVLEAFLSQYYLRHEVPPEVITAVEIEDSELLVNGLSERAGRRVVIKHRVRGERARWLDLAKTNSAHALDMRMASSASIRRQYQALAEALGMDEPPARMECFDISHTQGDATVASCVVFGPEGPLKSDYRRFNITGVQAGDDYGAMRQALDRRYTRVQKGEAPVPDLLIVDGGKGQLAQAESVLEELQLEGITLLGVAKGPSRKPGKEQLFLSGHERPSILPANSPALHLVQQIRDEAHRFAIAGHRASRGKARRTSLLEAIAGLGPKRRRELLKQFGGLQGVQQAGVEDLARVKGISQALAERIHATLREKN